MKTSDLFFLTTFYFMGLALFQIDKTGYSLVILCVVHLGLAIMNKYLEYKE